MKANRSGDIIHKIKATLHYASLCGRKIKHAYQITMIGETVLQKTVTMVRKESISPKHSILCRIDRGTASYVITRHFTRTSRLSKRHQKRAHRDKLYISTYITQIKEKSSMDELQNIEYQLHTGMGL